jgi:GntR family transcriptional regulator
MWMPLDPKSPIPLSSQMRAALVARVAAGRIGEGERLPSVRAFADALRLNPNTVAKVYHEMERDGLVEARGGAGVWIARGATATCRALATAKWHEDLTALVARAREIGLGDDAIASSMRERLRAPVLAGDER